MSRASRLGVGVLGASVVLGAWADVLLHGRSLGLNVFLWSLALVAALSLLLRVARAPLHQGRRWMIGPFVLFSAAFVWHDSHLLVAANLLAVAGAVALGALRRTQPQVRRAGVTDYAVGLAASGFSAFAGAVHLLHRDIEWSELGRAIRTDRSTSVARGLLLGLPLVALFGALFIAADAVFKNLVTTALPPIDHPVAHIVFAAVAAWLTAGLLRDLLASREDARLISPGAVLATGRTPFLRPLELGIALGALNVLFLAFVFVQLRYLFGGKGLVEARAHLTYAEYARHGFFELVVVALLVLPVLLAADAIVRPGTRRDVYLVRGLSAGLVALVFVVMASALQRMRLYEETYGLTQLRLYASGVIIWLGVVFFWFVLTALRGKRHAFAVGAVFAGFAATLALNVVNPDALIARVNLDRPRVDAAYLGRLSDDAVPVLLQRLSSLPPSERRVVARALLDKSRSSGDWRSFNISRASARSLLVSHRAELERFAR